MIRFSLFALSVLLGALLRPALDLGDVATPEDRPQPPRRPGTPESSAAAGDAADDTPSTVPQPRPQGGLLR